MKHIHFFSLFAIALISLSSCSIQKRHYRGGYNVTWKQAAPQNKVSGISGNDEAASPSLSASVENEAQPDLRIFDPQPVKDSCDVVLLKNGNSIQAKISEIALSTVKYKNCGDTDGPMRILDKNEIESITYSNGSKEDPANLKGQNPAPAPTPAPVVKAPRDNSPPPPPANPALEPKVHPLATQAMGMGFCSYIPVVGWIFAILSVIFGLVAISAAKAEPEKYVTDKSVRRALIGIAAGVVGLIAGILVVLSMIYGVFPW